jgi:hypothetical protein
MLKRRARIFLYFFATAAVPIILYVLGVVIAMKFSEVAVSLKPIVISVPLFEKDFYKSQFQQGDGEAVRYIILAFFSMVGAAVQIAASIAIGISAAFDLTNPNRNSIPLTYKQLLVFLVVGLLCSSVFYLAPSVSPDAQNGGAYIATDYKFFVYACLFVPIGWMISTSSQFIAALLMSKMPNQIKSG